MARVRERVRKENRVSLDISAADKGERRAAREQFLGEVYTRKAQQKLLADQKLVAPRPAMTLNPGRWEDCKKCPLQFSGRKYSHFGAKPLICLRRLNPARGAK